MPATVMVASVIMLLQVSRRVKLDRSRVPAATDSVSIGTGCVMAIMIVMITVMNRTALLVRYHSFSLSVFIQSRFV